MISTGVRTGKPPGRRPETRLRIETEYGVSLRDVLQDLYVQQNLSTEEIAKRLMVSKGTIPHWCRQLGLPVRVKGGFIRYREAVKLEMATMYATGTTGDAIAGHFGCAPETVHLAVRSAGMRMRSRRETTPRKYNLIHTYFDEIDTPIKAYLLGFIAADGCVAHNDGGTSLRVKIMDRDIEVLYEMQRELGGEVPVVRCVENHGGVLLNYVRLCAHSVRLCEGLKRHGIVPRKTPILEPPPTLPTYLVPHYIRGEFDGDGSVMIGWVGKSHLKISLCGTPMILRWMAEAFERDIGIPQNKICLRTPTFGHLSYSCSKAIAIRDYMYPTGQEFGLSRKKAKLFSVASKAG